MDKQSLDRIMKRVFYPDLEISKQLNEYRVEYQVLQEEMISVKPQMENLEKFKLQNKQLTQEVTQLSEQLEVIKKITSIIIKRCGLFDIFKYNILQSPVKLQCIECCSVINRYVSKYLIYNFMLQLINLSFLHYIICYILKFFL